MSQSEVGTIIILEDAVVSVVEPLDCILGGSRNSSPVGFLELKNQFSAKGQSSLLSAPPPPPNLDLKLQESHAKKKMLRM